MNKKILKICDIKNIFETRTLGQYNINFLGFHLISKNDFQRYNQIKICVKELKEFYPKTKSILVTKERNFSVLKKIINEIEFDGIQLHYHLSSPYLVKAIKAEFGKNFIIIQVLTMQSANEKIAGTHFTILDNSYLGGTGKEIGFEEIKELSDQGKLKNSLIAGGISSKTIDRYLDLDVKGFDVQSSVKKFPKSSTENTEFNKIKELNNKLKIEKKENNRQIGFVVQDISQNNSELLQESVRANIDFLHIDVSDGFIGKPSNISKIIKINDKIKNTNSHIPIQFHFYCQNIDSFYKYAKPFIGDDTSNSLYYVHINRDNDKEMKNILSKNFSDLYFSLDVKDIIDDTYPWEKYVRKNCILCTQSKKHQDRVFNINRSIKLLKYLSLNLKSITLDREIGPMLVYELENKSLINLVSGSYLSTDLSSKYKLLKEMLYE